MWSAKHGSWSHPGPGPGNVPFLKREHTVQDISKEAFILIVFRLCLLSSVYITKGSLSLNDIDLSPWLSIYVCTGLHICTHRNAIGPCSDWSVNLSYFYRYRGIHITYTCQEVTIDWSVPFLGARNESARECSSMWIHLKPQCDKPKTRAEKRQLSEVSTESTEEMTELMQERKNL